MTTKEEIRSLVGYEQRLYKMNLAGLIAEAQRVGAEPSLNRLELVEGIRKAQGLDDSIFHPPPLKVKI